jgi:hypothetical protein
MESFAEALLLIAITPTATARKAVAARKRFIGGPSG